MLTNGTVINVTSKDDDLWFGLRVSQKRLTMDGFVNVLQLQGGLTNFVCHPFVARDHFMTINC